jgi:hypothetical protein
MKIFRTVLIFGNSFLKAWILLLCYEWFLMPAFGLPQISYLMMFGVAMTFRILRPDFDINLDDFRYLILEPGNKKEKDKLLGTVVFYCTIKLLILWLVAFLIHLVV